MKTNFQAISRLPLFGFAEIVKQLSVCGAVGSARRYSPQNS